MVDTIVFLLKEENAVSSRSPCLPHAFLRLTYRMNIKE